MRNGEKLLEDVRNSGLLGNMNTTSKEEVQKDHEAAYKAKTLHGQLRKAKNEVKSEKSWDWLKKGCLKRETEIPIIAVQDQALNTNSMGKVVLGENVSRLCRLCQMCICAYCLRMPETSSESVQEYKT